MMELEIELKCTSDHLKKWSKSAISLVHCLPPTRRSTVYFVTAAVSSQAAGCDLYLQSVTRSVQTSQFKDFEMCKKYLLDLGHQLVEQGEANTQYFCVGFLVLLLATGARVTHRA